MLAAALRAVALVAFAGSAIAVELAGMHLERTLQVGAERLHLVSCGVRDALWMDVYVAGLYVPPAAPAEAVADPDRPKAVLMKIVESRYLPEDIPEKWRHTLRAELARDPMARVRLAYDHLRDGDVVTFAYQPGEGVTMSVNGRPVIRASGHQLIDSILAAWAEGDPISGKLQRLRLEHPC